MKAQQTQSIAKCVVAEAMEKYSALVNRQQAQVIANKHVVVEAVGKFKSMKDFAGVQEKRICSREARGVNIHASHMAKVVDDAVLTSALVKVQRIQSIAKSFVAEAVAKFKVFVVARRIARRYCRRLGANKCIFFAATQGIAKHVVAESVCKSLFTVPAIVLGGQSPSHINENAAKSEAHPMNNMSKSQRNNRRKNMKIAKLTMMKVVWTTWLKETAMRRAADDGMRSESDMEEEGGHRMLAKAFPAVRCQSGGVLFGSERAHKEVDDPIAHPMTKMSKSQKNNQKKRMKKTKLKMMSAVWKTWLKNLHENKGADHKMWLENDIKKKVAISFILFLFRRMCLRA